MNRQPRERPEGCVTDLKFDAWFAGELEGDARAAAEDHVAQCARCRERRARLAGDRAAFLAAQPSPTLRPRVPARPRWLRAGEMLGAAAVLGAVLAVALVQRRDEGAVEQAARLKGGAHIGFFVQRGDRSERGAPGRRVRPGDRIQFVYTSAQPAYLAIYARDAAGVVSVYFPAGRAAQRVSADHDAPLPAAVELDEILGPERVYARFCTAGFDVAGPARSLAEHGTLEPGPGCSVDELSWNKERAP